jgi:ADP-ribosylation factor-like protein 8
VDCANHEDIPVAKNELHDLLSKPSLENIPVLVLGNKNDLPDALSAEELIDAL